MPTNQSIMLGLGGFKFSISSAAYQQLQKQTDYGWSAVSRIGSHPAMQAVARGETTISMEGVVYPLYAGYASLDELHTIADRRKAVRMVSGATTGRNLLGYWVIKNIQQTNSEFIGGGQEQVQQFTIKLSYYGESAQ